MIWYEEEVRALERRAARFPHGSIAFYPEIRFPFGKCATNAPVPTQLPLTD